MMVCAAAPADVAWIMERTHVAPTQNFRAIKAIDNAGVIRGMIGYDCWTPNSVEAHMAVDTPIAWRCLAVPTFEYPFVQMGRRIMLGIIPASNAKSLKMAQRLGLQETYRIKDGFENGVDVIIHEIRRDDCRWLKRKAA